MPPRQAQSVHRCGAGGVHHWFAWAQRINRVSTRPCFLVMTIVTGLAPRVGITTVVIIGMREADGRAWGILSRTVQTQPTLVV
ncbi:hypothetical protein BDZ85DRAFT_72359 [Elsinoe ampelina]|uniref:Uncharacterized protein n=1 Tax=Elsinoe ampelina TaxID=302913 RepID=A0A6A6GJT3_9PEZI|nr:hypothetical protein BDZ85DRAFT_72359 [Elsinoe ampelina]